MSRESEPTLEVYITKDILDNMQKMCQRIDKPTNPTEEKTIQDIKGDCLIYLSNIVNKVSDFQDEELENYVIQQVNGILCLLQ